LEKAGSKRHANYTLECSFPGTLLHAALPED